MCLWFDDHFTHNYGEHKKGTIFISIDRSLNLNVRKINHQYLYSTTQYTMQERLFVRIINLRNMSCHLSFQIQQIFYIVDTKIIKA